MSDLSVSMGHVTSVLIVILALISIAFLVHYFLGKTKGPRF